VIGILMLMGNRQPRKRHHCWSDMAIEEMRHGRQRIDALNRGRPQNAAGAPIVI